MSCCSVRALIAGLLLVATGVAEERLTKDGRLKRDPVFIQGGKQIVYAVDETSDLIRLLRLDLASGKSEALHKDSTKSEFEIAFSADERHRVFTRCKSNLAMELVIRDMKTGKDVVIGHQGRGGYCRAAISPDASRVIYCFAETGPQHIFSVNIKGKEKKQLTTGTGIHNWPSFSPNGKQILFTSSRLGTYELFLMKSDGGEVKQITKNRSMELRARLSPNGKRVAYVTSKDGNREIYVMDVASGKQRRITNNSERDDYPYWHPDGKRLVYVSARDGSFDLYMADVPEK